MATLKQRLHRKNGTSYDIIHLETDASVVYLSSTDNTTVEDKITNIDEEMISVKTSVSEGKTLIASAITDKGVSTASDASFSTMADNISKIPSGISGVPIAGTDFTYSGEYQIFNDSDDEGTKWRIKFLTSGNFVPLSNMEIDAFYVGGGGGGAGGTGGSAAGTGGNSSAFGNIINGGNGGIGYDTSSGGAGGSGGGGAGINTNGDLDNGWNGGSDGSDGKGWSHSYAPKGQAGKGQGTTTREFGEPTGDLYAGGGGGGLYSKDGDYSLNYGGAGGGGHGGYGSISNLKPTEGVINTGGGGGGNFAGGGGGGGYTMTQKSIILEANTEYNIIIGDGGVGSVPSYNSGSNSGYKGGSGVIVIRNSRS